MPELVGKVGQILGRISTINLALRIDVRDVDQALITQTLGTFEHALEPDVELTEVLGELQLLRGRQGLPTKHQYRVLVHGGIDVRDLLRRERLGQINPRGFGCENGVQGGAMQTHDELQSFLFNVGLLDDTRPASNLAANEDVKFFRPGCHDLHAEILRALLYVRGVQSACRVGLDFL